MADEQTQTSNGPPGAVIEDWRRRVTENRNTAAMAFIGILVALAFQGVVAPAVGFINGSVSWRPVGQLVIFVVLGLWTFLAGSYNMTLSPYRGWAWFGNFVALTLSGFLLIFMASATAVPVGTPARVGFVGYYLAYFIIGTAWELLTLLSVFRNYRNQFKKQLRYIALEIIPFILVLILEASGSAYSNWAIALLLTATLATFILTIGLLVSDSLI
jgi:hypothetical protein